MRFFQYTKEFDLEKHFDWRIEPDVRLQLHGLHQRTKETVARERNISLEVVLLIGCLEVQNAAVNLGLGKREHLAKSLGLRSTQYWKRAQAGRLLVAFPEFIELVKRGHTHVSHLSVIAPKISQANSEIFLKEISHKSERKIRELAASINRDGSRNLEEPLFDLRLRLTKSQLAVLDRAQEVLSATGKVPSQEEALIKALEDLLEKRDPMRKAQRAAKRAAKASTAAPQSQIETQAATEGGSGSVRTPVNQAAGHGIVAGGHRGTSPSPISAAVPQARKGIPLARKGIPLARKGIPQATVHAVILRDGGCCKFLEADGTRCGSRIGVQIDHVVPVSYGQDNRLENLRLLCREHQIAEGERILGGHVMRRYRGIVQQSTVEVY